MNGYHMYKNKKENMLEVVKSDIKNVTIKVHMQTIVCFTKIFKLSHELHNIHINFDLHCELLFAIIYIDKFMY